MTKYLLLLALLVLTGCGTILTQVRLETTSGVEHPELTPWAQAETVRLAGLYGTNPDTATKFLDRGPVDGVYGWTSWYITVVLRDEDGNAFPYWLVRNIWHHEWLHTRGVGWWRFGDHQEEFNRELDRLGLREFRPGPGE